MDVVNVVSTVGFPIACCIGMGWFCKYLWDMYAKSVSKMLENYENLISSYVDVISNNTQAITTLSENIKFLTTVHISDTDNSKEGD